MNDIFSIPYGESGKAQTLYAIVLSTTELGQAYRVSIDAFEALTAGNWSSFALNVIEVATTGIYQFELPGSLKVQGNSYAVAIYEKPSAGATAAPSDTLKQAGGMTFGEIAPVVRQVSVISD